MNPMKNIFEKPAQTGRISHWRMFLSEYDIEYRTQKYIKRSMLACYLAHQSIEDYQPIQFYFLDEDVMAIRAKDYDEPGPDEGPEPGSRWGLVFDGASNAYGHGVGAIIFTHRGSHIPFVARICFRCTNNMVEYEACIIVLEEAIDLSIKILDVFGD
ncbi:uncharacterized protein LOC127123802 [Lathyrus oleraceus]|uniref:uncharacterized protein LOC127123802 n=1 Tax=Pisum sativum TaxID=3888 RepID=UPI0021CF6EBC|nr:uncharacterized protein LOC127123802 [Pisum sativum]